MASKLGTKMVTRETDWILSLTPELAKVWIDCSEVPRDYRLSRDFFGTARMPLIKWIMPPDHLTFFPPLLLASLCHPSHYVLVDCGGAMSTGNNLLV